MEAFSPQFQNFIVNKDLDYIFKILKRLFEEVHDEKDKEIFINDPKGIMLSEEVHDELEEEIVINELNDMMIVDFAETIDWDFTTASLQAYGSDPQVQVSHSPDLFAFYLGDLDQNGWIDASDFNIFEPELTAGSTGFYTSDFDGGGWVDAVDFNLFEPRITAGNAAEYPGKK